MARLRPDAPGPGVAPPPGNPRFPHLDGLRAIAALGVLVSHTAGYTTFAAADPVLGPVTARLNVGVTIFFVLSGFLLHRPFVLARLEGRRGPRWTVYARRRLLRIVPAYWLALTLLAIWPGLTGVFTGDWWVFYGFVQNLRTVWVVQGLGPAWSLAVEMSFYLALPFLALAAHRALASRPPRVQLRLELAGLAALSLISVGLRVWQRASEPGSSFANTLPTMFLWFALGMAVAVCSAHWRARPVGSLPGWARLAALQPWVPWAGALGLLAVSTRLGLPVDLNFRYTDATWLLEHLLFAGIAVLLLLPAVFGAERGGRVRGLLACKPVAWLGLVSYGIFLWHAPLAAELTHLLSPKLPDGAFVVVTLATVAAATTAAALSYYLVERPLRRFKDPPPRGGRRARDEPAQPVPVGLTSAA